MIILTRSWGKENARTWAQVPRAARPARNCFAKIQANVACRTTAMRCAGFASVRAQPCPATSLDQRHSSLFMVGFEIMSRAGQLELDGSIVAGPAPADCLQEACRATGPLWARLAANTLGYYWQDAEDCQAYIDSLGAPIQVATLFGPDLNITRDMCGNDMENWKFVFGFRDLHSCIDHGDALPVTCTDGSVDLDVNADCTQMMQDAMADLHTACCPAGVTCAEIPDSCTPQCAEVFAPFYNRCAAFVAGLGGTVDASWSALNVACEATVGSSAAAAVAQPGGGL